MNKYVIVVLVVALSSPCLLPFVVVVAQTFTSPYINGTQLKVGRAINIFSRYGYLSISMRVVPRNDSGQAWLFREPTVDVFSFIDDYIVNRRAVKVRNKPPPVADFHMEFCDNMRQLLQAYFRDFSFDKLEKPWRAFTSSWVPEVMARNLGINSSFVNGDYCYVLVRYSRFHESYKLSKSPDDFKVGDSVQQEIKNIKVGDPASVVKFIKKFGSHYVSSYVTGNSLYQVFVYNRRVYLRIRDRLKSVGVTNISNTELTTFFSPWYAEHMGQIKVASGNQTVEAWASSKLRVFYSVFSYLSLLKLYRDNELLAVVGGLLKNEALLQLDLRTLTPLFKNETQKMWFKEVLDNYLKLWETNM